LVGCSWFGNKTVKKSTNTKFSARPRRKGTVKEATKNGGKKKTDFKHGYSEGEFGRRYKRDKRKGFLGEDRKQESLTQDIPWKRNETCCRRGC